MPRQSTNMLDLVVEDLSLWIDELAGQLAEGMSAGGTAPFAAQLTEQQKMDYYTAKLFNPDGTPNLPGRASEMQRLGPEGFAMVFKAVVKAHPDLAIPTPPPGAAIPAPTDFSSPVVPGPNIGLPTNLGVPRMNTQQQLAEQALASVSPGSGQGPLG